MTSTSVRERAAAGEPPAPRRRVVRLPQRYATWAGPWLLLPLLVGAVLRLVAVLTYWPGVDFLGDSYDYLANARNLRPGLWHPLVYPTFLRLVSLVGPVGLVAVVQSALGLLAGVLVYRLGRRLGLGDGAAALAAAPVLLDAWQLALEQIVMSEALFEALLSGALLLLLPRGPLRVGRGVAGGLLLSLAVLTRTVALPVGALLGVLLLVRRVGWRPLLATGAAVVLPILGYASAFAATYGPFGLQGLSGRQVYGVTAVVARCHVLPHDQLTATLCPRTPPDARAGNNQYTWDASTPLTRVALHARTSDDRILEFNRNGARFAREVMTAQPLAITRSVLASTLRYFTVGREARLRDYPQVAWQFLGTRSPAAVFDIRQDGADFRGNRPPGADAPLPPTAGLLRAYQRVAYTPGPLLAVALGLGLLAALRRRSDRAELLVLSLGGLGVLALPSVGAGFDFRYVLTALLLLPTAGLLGLQALRRPAASGTAPTIPAAAPRRRPLVVGASALAVALLVTGNVARAGLVPADREVVGTRAGYLGETVALHDGLSVAVGRPVRVAAKCRQIDFQASWWWVVVVPVSVRTTGHVHLVQAADLTGVTGDPWSLTRRPGQRGAVSLVRRGRGRLDPPVVLSARHPGLEALATVFTDRAVSELRWADPGGAGVAAWPYRVAVSGLPAPGSLCDSPGESLRGRVLPGDAAPDAAQATPTGVVPGPSGRSY